MHSAAYQAKYQAQYERFAKHDEERYDEFVAFMYGVTDSEELAEEVAAQMEKQYTDPTMRRIKMIEWATNNQLIHKCSRCNGMGAWYDYGKSRRWVDCPECNQIGYRPGGE